MVNRNEVHSSCSRNSSKRKNSVNRPNIRPALKFIGLHSFSRRLYRDVPDEFDDLKKLFVRAKNYIEKLKHDAPSSHDLIAETTSILSHTFSFDPNLQANTEFITQFTDSSTTNLVEASQTTQLTTVSNGAIEVNKAPNWFKWKPKSDALNGDAVVSVWKNGKEELLKYHIGNFSLLSKETFLFGNYLNILSFAFENYLEKNRIDMDEFNRENGFVRVNSKCPIKFFVNNSYHEYSILDVFKIYFDFLIKSIEGSNESLQWVVVTESDYRRFHNTQIHTAIDIGGLDLISENDFKQRNLYDFFQLVQYQLDVACENLFDEKPAAIDHKMYRNIVKSFGREELEDEYTFEIELTSNGNSNVYVLNKEKRVLTVRNHLGDFEALNARKNREYDPEIITCYKALVNYVFKFLVAQDSNLKSKINSKDFCFEFSKDPTRFHFKGDEHFFSIQDALCKYIQYISASVSKITMKNARKVIISTQSNYDIFRSKILRNAIKQSGYKFEGQYVYELFNRQSIDDKLEILFNKMYKLLIKNDMSKIRNEEFKKIPDFEESDRDETFTLEFFSYDTVKMAATVDDNFVGLKNHIGDVDELDNIRREMDFLLENSKESEEIAHFINIIKFGFEHIGRNCENEPLEQINNAYFKVTNKNPIRFTVEDSPVEYSIEDLFVKYFRYMAKSVSRRTRKSARKVLLTLPSSYNILQKTLLKCYIELAEIKCIRVLPMAAARIMTLEFDKKFHTPGKYILIDMNTKNLTLTLFEYKNLNETNLVILKNKSVDKKKVQLDLKKHKKFNILATFFDENVDSKKLESSIMNLILQSSPKCKEFVDRDPSLIYKYSLILQEQFNDGIFEAVIQLDPTNVLRVSVDQVNKIMYEYAEQANKLLEVVLLDQNLDLNKDIVRVDFTCKLFSVLFGAYLKDKNPNAPHKFNCIDGFNTQDIYAYLNDLEENSELLSTNLSTNIGFSIAGGIFDVHLKRNTELPCKFTKSYVTAFDYQTELLFPMYMGERPLVRYCDSLGQVKVKNIPKAKAGELNIEITLFVDQDENLFVTAVENKNKKNLPVEFQFQDVYESKGIKMILDAIKYRVSDFECDRKVKEFKSIIREVRTKYDDYHIREEMNALLNSLNKSKDLMSAELVDGLLSILHSKIKELNLKKIDLKQFEKNKKKN